MAKEYLDDLYTWVSKTDDSFSKRYSPEKFKENMQREDYSSQMFDWISNTDETFKDRYTRESFQDKVKKKGESQRTSEKEDTGSDTEQEEGLTGLSAVLANDKGKRKKKKKKKFGKQQFKKTTGIRVTKDRDKTKEGKDEGGTGDEDIKAEQVVEEPIDDTKKKKDKKKKIKEQDVEEVTVYSDKKKNRKLADLLDKAKALANTVAGRIIDKKNKYPDLTIESVEEYIEDVKDYQEKATQYERAKRLVEEGKMTTSNFLSRYKEGGWDEVDPNVRKLSDKELKELREEWDKKVSVDAKGPEYFIKKDYDDKFQERREAFLDKIGEENIIDLQWDGSNYNYTPEQIADQIELNYGDMGIEVDIQGDKLIINSSLSEDDQGLTIDMSPEWTDYDWTDFVIPAKGALKVSGDLLDSAIGSSDEYAQSQIKAIEDFIVSRAVEDTEAPLVDIIKESPGVFTPEAYEKISTDSAAKIEGLMVSYNDIVKKSNDLEKLITTQNTPPTVAQIELANSLIDEYKKVVAQIRDEESILKEINLAVGISIRDKARTQENLGTFTASLAKSFLAGIEDILSGIYTLLETLDATLDEGQFLLLETLLEAYGEKDKAEAIKKYADVKDLDRKKRIKIVREVLEGSFTDSFATKDDFINNPENSMLYTGTTGVFRSLPAMLLNAAGPIVGTVAMATQVFDSVAEEWVNNPNYEKMPLHDLLIVGGLIGTMQAILERAGLETIFTTSQIGKGMFKNVLGRVVKKVGGKKVPVSTWKRLVAEETESLLANGVVKISKGTLTEGITGGSQEVVDQLVKTAYNNNSGTTMFELPKNWKEVFSQIAEGAILEAIGGALMSTAMTAPKMLKDGIQSVQMTPDMLELLHFMSDSPKLQSSMIKTLKMEILKGKMSKKDAKFYMDQFKTVIGVMEEIPNDVENKAKAFDLIVEYNRVATEIQNKNENLVTAQKARMKEIEAELDALVETKTKDKDAIQKPSPKKVDVPESTEDSGEVGEGDVRTPPETPETTEEIQDETKKTEEKEVSLADKIREGKLKGKGTLSTIIPVQVWDTALEGVALTVETIEKVINKIKKSDWYKSRDVKTRSNVDKELQGMKDALDRGEEVPDPREKAAFPEGKQKLINLNLKLKEDKIKEDLELKEEVKQRKEAEKEGTQEYIDEAEQRKAEGEESNLNILEGKLKELERQLTTLTEENPYYQIAENMDKITPESARNETGGKVGTNQDISPALTSKRGVSVEEAAENLGTNGGLSDVLGYDHGFSDQDIRNEIIDILKNGKQAYQNKILGDIKSEIKETKAQIKEAKQNIKKKKTKAKVSFGKKRYEKITNFKGRVKIKTKKKTDPPSPKKIIGTPKDTKVTVKEKTALKDQIKLEARAAREATKSYKDAAKDLASSINKLAKDGKISAKTAENLIKKALSLNLLNTTQVENFQDYVEQTLEAAEVEGKMDNADKKRRKALKNLKAKVTFDNSLLSVLRELFTLNPEVIPDSQLDSYIDLVTQFGQSKKVLRDLAESGEVIEQAGKIIDAVITENEVSDTPKGVSNKNTLEELEAALEEVKDKEDIESKAITSRIEYLIEQKKEANKKAEEEGQKLLKDVLENKINLKNVSKFTDAQNLARELNNLTKEDIDGLVVTKKDGTKDYTMVDNLSRVKENINKGYMPALANTIMNKVEVNRSKKKIKNIVDTRSKKRSLRMAFSTIYGGLKSLWTLSGSKTQQQQSLRGTMTTAVDDVFGNFNDKTIYDNTFGKLATAYSAYQSDLKFNVTDKLDKAEVLLSQGLLPTTLKSVKKVKRSKYLVQTYRLQREFESNPDSKQVASALDFINETIKSPLTSKIDKKVLREIKENYTDDNIYGDEKIDMNKIENAMSRKEKKALKLIDEAASMEQKANWTATVIRGTGIKPISNYMHHEVLMNDKDAKKDYTAQQEKFTRPSTKSQTLIERKGGAKPINFDPISSTKRGAVQTLLDYHVTDALRVVDNTIKELTKEILDNPNSTNNQKQLILALQSVVNEVNSGVFEVALGTGTPLSRIINEGVRLGYRATLGSVPRSAAEIVSNLSYAMTNPKDFGKAMKSFAQFSMGNQGYKAMMALNSKETMKNYGGQNLSSKMVDANLSKTTNTVQQKEHIILERLSRMTQFGPKQIKLISDLLADQLITSGDKLIARPMWFGSFARSFKASTGISLTAKDMQEIADGTSKYLGPEFKEARENATKYADQESVKMTNSRNPFNVVPKNVITKDDASYVAAYKTVNSYLASFALNEYVTARNAVLNLSRKGEISKSQAAATLAGITGRMTAYVSAYTFAKSFFDSYVLAPLASLLFGDTEEEREEEYQKEVDKAREEMRKQLEEQFKDADDKEKLIEKNLDFLYPDDKRKEKEVNYGLLLVRQLAGSMLTLITQRGLGNVPRSMIGLGIEEYINKPYLDDFREGEDPFKIAEEQQKEVDEIRKKLEEQFKDADDKEKLIEENLKFLTKKRFGEEEITVKQKEYDRFTDALTFNILSQEDLQNKSLPELLIHSFSGPLGPVSKIATRAWGNLQRIEKSEKESTKEKYRERLKNVSLLQVLGSVGLIPLYKDINKYMSNQYYQKENRIDREEKIEEAQEQILEYLKNNEVPREQIKKYYKQYKGIEERMRQEVQKMKDEGASVEELKKIIKAYGLEETQSK